MGGYWAGLMVLAGVKVGFLSAGFLTAGFTAAGFTAMPSVPAAVKRGGFFLAAPALLSDKPGLVPAS